MYNIIYFIFNYIGQFYLPMLQLSKVFEGHKFVIWFRRPRINFNRILKSYYKKFDSFIFNNTKVNSALEFTHVYPSIPPFRLLKQKSVHCLHRATI